jgi:hypothetical protein
LIWQAVTERTMTWILAGQLTQLPGHREAKPCYPA